MLYNVRDHMSGNLRYTPEGAYSFAASPKSEFLKAAEGVPVDALLSVIDEHLEAVRAIYPKEYRAVIKRIESLA